MPRLHFQKKTTKWNENINNANLLEKDQMHQYLWVFTFIFVCFYSVYVKLELQKHQFADVLQIKCSPSFRNIQPKPCNFIKKRLQHICFPVNIANILRVVFYRSPLVAASGIFLISFFSYFA